MHQVSLDDLRQLLDPLDTAPVECDGMTRLVYTVLAREQIEASVFVGQLTVGGRSVAPHYWAEVGQYRIDYRARMWLGLDASVPHGVYRKADTIAQYHGEQIDIAPLSEALFEALATPWASELMGYKEVCGADKSLNIKGMS